MFIGNVKSEMKCSLASVTGGILMDIAFPQLPHAVLRQRCEPNIFVLLGNKIRSQAQNLEKGLGVSE